MSSPSSLSSLYFACGIIKKKSGVGESKVCVSRKRERELRLFKRLMSALGISPYTPPPPPPPLVFPHPHSPSFPPPPYIFRIMLKKRTRELEVSHWREIAHIPSPSFQKIGKLVVGDRNLSCLLPPHLEQWNKKIILFSLSGKPFKKEEPC